MSTEWHRIKPEDSTLATLAGKWQAEADAHVTSPSTYGTARRETLRECADALRMLCEVRFEDCPQQDAQRRSDACGASGGLPGCTAEVATDNK